jgi:outer membrane lipoprotein-sorting protein
MKAAALLALSLIGAVCVGAPAALAQTAQEIVAAADKIRNPSEPFRVTDTLVEYHGGKPQNRLVLAISSKIDGKTGQFRNLVRYVDPARDAGKILLMNASIMWFYDPASSASVRISPQQRLLGQASNGDVMTINLARDYTAKMVGAETIQDADRQDRTTWHLDLLAANDDAVYARVEYWVEKGTNRPVKGKFYADSGRLLKIIYYRKYEQQMGALRPVEAIILDEVDSSLVTKMTLSNFEGVEIPESWFQREYLPHFKGS